MQSYLSQAVRLQDFVKGAGLLLERQFTSGASVSGPCFLHLKLRVRIPKVQQDVLNQVTVLCSAALYIFMRCDVF